jgi:hypothetical protein
MVPALSTLDELGVRFGTDKSSLTHDYLTFYERFFRPLRNKPITILEIGVLKGASLRVWHAYFPRARIIGADINPGVPRFDDSRVTVEILDQSNLEHLVTLGVRHGPFDIIIEDGSHQWEHQITTFRTLFPFVRNGGIYIAEDLQTNYGGAAEHYRGIATISCMEYLKRLVDLRVADDQLDIRLEEDAFLRTYGRAVQFVAFYRRACLVEKAFGGASVDQRAVQPILSSTQSKAAEPLVLLAHIGGVGDRRAESGAVRGLMEVQNIQGFQLKQPGKDTIPLEYRVRRQDHTWGEWVPLGRFAGTRGQSQHLTGFTIRLAGSAKDAFEAEVVGLFRDALQPVIVGDGQDCVSRSGDGLLYGMQVSVTRKTTGR